MRKKRVKSEFTHQLTIYIYSAKKDELIITYVGFETINYPLALKYFSLEEIFKYWECCLDLEKLISEELEKFEELATSNYYSLNRDEQKELLASSNA